MLVLNTYSKILILRCLLYKEKTNNNTNIEFLTARLSEWAAQSEYGIFSFWASAIILLALSATKPVMRSVNSQSLIISVNWVERVSLSWCGDSWTARRIDADSNESVTKWAYSEKYPCVAAEVQASVDSVTWLALAATNCFT